jgi:hypothetical protein
MTVRQRNELAARLAGEPAELDPFSASRVAWAAAR